MFKLLRRISSSVYPRPDRPWGDDATSNAPTIGRKRRMSDEDDDMPDVGTTRKRRGQLEREGTSELGELSVKGKETDPAVKEVTQGVKQVDLEEKKVETPKAETDQDAVGEEVASGETVGESAEAKLVEDGAEVKSDGAPVAEEPQEPSVDPSPASDAPISEEALSASELSTSSPDAVPSSEETGDKEVVVATEVAGKDQEIDTQTSADSATTE
ncbi:hypothetical protein BV25DRAFT_1830179 [Artomyces pyxidatus]|uniref:Uncharacterized protein n=1 Tax=Artomyces pyxidatus TaxID=48021 RepID=A0ACB8SR78_9AGAM|nr:hypothetical protein BV25DRAFT_1830179 [Artomyces pyxidatus]